MSHSPTRLMFFDQEDSVPVRAPPTEVPEMELDEHSGRQTPTEAIEETKGQDVSFLHFMCYVVL